MPACFSFLYKPDLFTMSVCLSVVQLSLRPAFTCLTPYLLVHLFGAVYTCFMGDPITSGQLSVTAGIRIHPDMDLK